MKQVWLMAMKIILTARSSWQRVTRYLGRGIGAPMSLGAWYYVQNSQACTGTAYCTRRMPKGSIYSCRYEWHPPTHTYNFAKICHHSQPLHKFSAP